MKWKILCLLSLCLLAYGCQKDDSTGDKGGENAEQPSGGSGDGGGSVDGGGSGGGSVDGGGSGEGGSGEGGSGEGGSGEGGSGEGGSGEGGSGEGGSGEGEGGYTGDPALDPSIPRDVVGGLASEMENQTCVDGMVDECLYNYYLECKDNHYYIKDDCGLHDNSFCLDGTGCATCVPGTALCEDNSVYTCRDDGTGYDLTKSCGISLCQDGACMADNCPENAQFIYLVDSSYNMLKFNPGAKDGNYLEVLFQLNCSSASSPYSMAVDRDANAWVLYHGSTVYKVNIENNKCEKMEDFSTNGSGLTLFGMAFSLDSVGATTDTLYIGDSATSGRFGSINTENMSYQPLATFPSFYQTTPELTGTGLAKLYAFSPGQYEQHISEIDKATGNVVLDYKLPGAGGSINAWAFAHWGGYFFIFETVSGINKILRFDPATESVEVFLDSTLYRVVGAGVSTCAPTSVIL